MQAILGAFCAKELTGAAGSSAFEAEQAFLPRGTTPVVDELYYYLMLMGGIAERMLDSAEANVRRDQLAVQRILVALFFVVSIQAIAGQANADDEATERARNHFVQAQKEYDLGNWDASAREFSWAYELRPDPIFLYNMAQAYRRGGNLQRAVDLYKNYLLKDPKSPQRAEVEQRILRLQKQLDEDRAARIGAPAAATPAPTVEPPQQIEGQAPPLAKPSAITEAQASGPAASATAAASVSTPAPAIEATGDSVAATAPASVATRVAAQPTTGRRLRIAGIVIGAAGALGIGAGAIFSWRTQSLSNSVSNASRYSLSDAQSGKNAAVLQWVCYGVGGAALITGALLYWRGRTQAEAARVSLIPLVGPDTVGLASAGTF